MGNTTASWQSGWGRQGDCQVVVGPWSLTQLFRLSPLLREEAHPHPPSKGQQHGAWTPAMGTLTVVNGSA